MIRRVHKGSRLYTEDTLHASRSGAAMPSLDGGEWSEASDGEFDERAALREFVQGVASAAGGGSQSTGGKRGVAVASSHPFLTEQELAEYEETYSEGITAAQLVDIFVTRGMRFSEATFRKYVQQGLLPRSRRVGRKGKHRGSLGVYPCKTVRRVNSIKQLMARDYTIEQIQQQFLRFTDLFENLEESVSELLSSLDVELRKAALEPQERRAFKRDIVEVRKASDELLRRLEELSRRVAAPRGDHYETAGAAGSAEDLL